MNSRKIITTFIALVVAFMFIYLFITSYQHILQTKIGEQKHNDTPSSQSSLAL